MAYKTYVKKLIPQKYNYKTLVHSCNKVCFGTCLFTSPYFLIICTTITFDMQQFDENVIFVA